MRSLILVMSAALSVAACSTVPRSYTPILADPGSADAEFAAVVEQCSTLVDAGIRTGFRDSGIASAATGVAAGYGAGAVIFTTAAAGESLAGLAAASSVAIWAMPVVGILVAHGYSRRARARRESELQSAMTVCLSEYDYDVVDWHRVPDS